MSEIFTVASIAKEPLPVLRRFVRWHLDQGADRIILYLDDPADVALTSLAGEPRLEMRPCTPALWSGLGLAPDTRFTRRQRAVLNQAYSGLERGWLLVIDADEFLWLRDRSVPQMLADQPPEAQSIRVLSAEEVRLPDGSTGLRTALPKAQVDTIYGATAGMLRPRFGLVYHSEGKSLHRAGQADIEIKLHWAERADGSHTPGPVLTAADRTHLVHLAAPDYDRWRAKLDWRVGAHGYAEATKVRIAEAAASPDPEAAYRLLYDDLHSLDAGQARDLAAAGGLLTELPPLPGL